MGRNLLLERGFLPLELADESKRLCFILPCRQKVHKKGLCAHFVEIILSKKITYLKKINELKSNLIN